MPRKAEPTGGPGHPFEHGEITLSIGWNGHLQLVCWIGGTPMPHELTPYELDQIQALTDKIRLIVYRAQWRAVHAQEEADKAEAERRIRAAEDAEEKAARDELYPPFEIEVRTLPIEPQS